MQRITCGSTSSQPLLSFAQRAGRVFDSLPRPADQSCADRAAGPPSSTTGRAPILLSRCRVDHSAIPGRRNARPSVSVDGRAPIQWAAASVSPTFSTGVRLSLAVPPPFRQRHENQPTRCKRLPHASQKLPMAA